jgi:acetyl-CoA carboxylase biotin carboxyl carrier protein
MPFQQIDKIRELLAGTRITSLELSGPRGHVRLVNEATSEASPKTFCISPAAGRFLHRHPLSRTAMVAPGTQVTGGDIIGLLQIGVLLIPVAAPCAGQVAGHLVAEGTLVGYGTRLIALHPISPKASP